MASKDSGSANIVGNLIDKRSGEVIKEDTGTNVYQWLKKETQEKLRAYGIYSMSDSNLSNFLKGSHLQFEFVKNGQQKIYNGENVIKTERKAIIENIKEENKVDLTLKLLQKKKQIILYGPPGTGKTYNTKSIAIKLLGDGKTYEEYQEEGRIEFITFHPSYSYEEFIEGITVATEGEDIPTESLKYVCKSGIFKNICKRALGSAIGLSQDKLNSMTWIKVYDAYRSKTTKEKLDFKNAPVHVLIIDEINRGDIAKILGELITLLEADKRLGEENELIAKLPASGDRFCVPPNLYIIATMNTADRSLALLDVALRRRFGFIEMNPDLDLIVEHINKNPAKIKEDAHQLLIKSIAAVKKINGEISKDKAIGRDKQIGHSFLFKVHTIDDLILAWRHEILPLLEEYCYSDYLKINQIAFGRDTDWISQTDGIKEINRMNIGQMLDEIIKE